MKRAKRYAGRGFEAATSTIPYVILMGVKWDRLVFNR